MKRSPMSRGHGFGPHRPKPERHPLLVPKNLGESARGYKTIPRDQDHMARVAALGCIVCHRGAQFHHIDILTRKGAGPKVSDYIGIGLCPDHHLDDVHDSAHGRGGERAFWSRHDIDIGAVVLMILRRWYPEPSENVAAAIAAIEKQRAIVSG